MCTEMNGLIDVEVNEMVETANVVEIKSVVNQLINPHRQHLSREAEDPRAWGRFLKQLGQGNHSRRLIQWVCAHPIYLIEVQGDAFRKKPVALVELLRRENLVRHDFIRTWMRFETSPRSSLLQHVENQRHALQIASMMWFSPVLSMAYDYQELFQSLCEFSQIVRALIESSRGLSLISEPLVKRVAECLWSDSLGITRSIGSPAVSACGATGIAPTVGDMLDSQERFQRLIGRSMRLQVSAHLVDRSRAVAMREEDSAVAYWRAQLFDQVRSTIKDWYSPVNREETRLGPCGVQEIYGDLYTYLSYRLIDSGLRMGLCL